MNNDNQRFSQFHVYFGNDIYLDDVILDREVDVDTATHIVSQWNEYPEAFKLVGF